MFTTGPNYGKLKTNLRLAINRLKLLEKKKTELAQKGRKEIADYLVNGKYERAKIRVEHIIREDYIVEAMELVEMYCDLLLARFGLLQQMKVLDEGLAEAISSLIWAAPRLQSDVAELKAIADQLAFKYGKPYAQAAKENALNSVNEKLVHKLSVQAPPKILVEKYLIEIAKSHNVSYEPDTDVMAQEEKAADVLTERTLIDFGGDAKPLEPGFVVGNISGGEGIYPAILHPPPKPPRPFDYPPCNKQLEAMKGPQPPPIPTNPPTGPTVCDPNKIGFNYDAPAPPYDSVVGPKSPPLQSHTSSLGATNKPTNVQFPSDTLPELPSVPNTVLPDLNAEGGDNEVDFDDLTKRFEDLKKRK